MEELLLNIANYGIAFSVLIAVIFYFLGKEKKKDAEIEELHKELRDSEKENLTTLYKVMALMEKLTETDKIKNELLLKEIGEMRTSIENKIDNLK